MVNQRRLSRAARADLLLRAAARWQMDELSEYFFPRWSWTALDVVVWAAWAVVPDVPPSPGYQRVAASLALSEVCGMGYDLEDAEVQS